MESVLKSQFYLLIQQFAVDPERVARTLYGISVIDLNDLDIATSHVLPELERGKVLAVTLIRRLRRWPDLFGDVCRVLTDIPAMQETDGKDSTMQDHLFHIYLFFLTAKVRQLLYEECSEDQYSKILEQTSEWGKN